MAQLRQGYDEIVNRNAEVVVVGPEDRATFATYWDKEHLPFVGLADPHHHVADLFGQESKILKLGRLPAQVIIDLQGVVRFAHFGHSMAEIPKNEDILEALDAL